MASAEAKTADQHSHGPANAVNVNSDHFRCSAQHRAGPKERGGGWIAVREGIKRWDPAAD